MALFSNSKKNLALVILNEMRSTERHKSCNVLLLELDLRQRHTKVLKTRESVVGKKFALRELIFPFLLFPFLSFSSSLVLLLAAAAYFPSGVL